MKIKFLLLGTSLSFIPNLSYAQCLETTNCEALGYTENSCNSGKGLKCPFGEKWLCAGDEESICRENGFTESCIGAGQSGSGSSCGGLYVECLCDSSYQYTCTGTGYAGGNGTACNGKYTKCNCANTHIWQNGACKVKMSDGLHGDLYYCNGIVVGIKIPGTNYMISMNETGRIYHDNAKDIAERYNFCGKEGIEPNSRTVALICENKDYLNSLLSQNGGAPLLDNSAYWTSDYQISYDSRYYHAMWMDSCTTDAFSPSGTAYFRAVAEF